MTEDEDTTQGNGDDDAVEGDDAEGQALTWKVKRPIPESRGDEDDTEGQASRPFQRRGPDIPAVDDDDTEGHAGPTGVPFYPVD